MTYAEEKKIMPNTVRSVFDHVRLYQIDNYVMAANTPFAGNEQRKVKMAGQLLVNKPFLQKRYFSKITYKTIKEVNSDYPINRDWRPVCEYYIGLMRYQ